MLERAREEYRKFGVVVCPALDNANVHFTGKGFNHLLYKSGNKARRKQDQFMRLKMLGLAKRIIEISTTYQDYDEDTQTTKINARAKKKQNIKTVKYWGLIAILEGKRLKVIVRQIGNGAPHFWSIIPQWKTLRTDDTFKRIFRSGNPETD